MLVVGMTGIGFAQCMTHSVRDRRLRSRVPDTVGVRYPLCPWFTRSTMGIAYNPREVICDHVVLGCLEPLPSGARWRLVSDETYIRPVVGGI